MSFYKHPVIVCGMHRSGTSLVTKIIESQGVFMGDKKQGDNESVFFIDINEKIFKMINAGWDNPDNFNFVNRFFNKNIIHIINNELKSFHSIKYFGFSKYFNNHNFLKIKYDWGWKDPRNTFTADYWKEIFPDAKIIHIYRNPVDVAHSMRIRQQNFIEKYEESDDFKNYCNKIKFLGTSYRCLDLDEGFMLWEKYISRAFKIEKNIHHISYEELLNDPENEIKLLMDFIKIFPKKKAFNSEISNIDKSRLFAFIGDKELEDFYLKVKDNRWVKKLNYQNLT